MRRTSTSCSSLRLEHTRSTRVGAFVAPHIQTLSLSFTHTHTHTHTHTLLSSLLSTNNHTTCQHLERAASLPPLNSQQLGKLKLLTIVSLASQNKVGQRTNKRALFRCPPFFHTHTHTPSPSPSLPHSLSPRCSSTLRCLRCLSCLRCESSRI
jgi:hypothetical protein